LIGLIVGRRYMTKDETIIMLDDRLTRARLALRAVVYSDTLDRAQEEAFQGLKNSELTDEKKAVR
jgi:hypothetical protein